MQNKTRKWTDVQLIISSISMAVTLGIWSLLASREKMTARVPGEASLQTQSDAAVVPAAMLLPGETLYLNGIAPKAPTPVLLQARPNRRRGGGAGGGGGGGGGASTGSS